MPGIESGPVIPPPSPDQMQELPFAQSDTESDGELIGNGDDFLSAPGKESDEELLEALALLEDPSILDELPNAIEKTAEFNALAEMPAEALTDTAPFDALTDPDVPDPEDDEVIELSEEDMIEVKDLNVSDGAPQTPFTRQDTSYGVSLEDLQ